MNSTIAKKPLFSRTQWVKFIGGIGKIKDFWLDSGAWIYAVEMKPDTATEAEDRLTILLHEPDIQISMSSTKFN